MWFLNFTILVCVVLADTVKTYPLFSELHSMTMTKVNRAELQDTMIQQILDDMDIKTMMAILYDNMSESYDKYSDAELLEEVKEYYPHILEEDDTNWVGCLTNWQGGTVSVENLPIPCHHTGMKTKRLLSSPQTLQDLQDFMFDTMASSEMAVDWFCDRFNVNATDEVIDFVVDAHFAFFGEW